MTFPHNNIKTTPQQLKTIATKLMTSSMKSTISVQIELNVNPKHSEDLKTTVNITFFEDETNFTISLYSFWELEKNEKLVVLAKELMEKRELFSETKKIIKDM